MVFYGICSLLPNAAILSDMDYFINKVRKQRFLILRCLHITLSSFSIWSSISLWW